MGFLDKLNSFLANALGKLLPILAILYVIAGVIMAITGVAMNRWMSGGEAVLSILVAFIVIPLSAIILFGSMAVLIDIRNILARKHDR